MRVLAFNQSNTLLAELTPDIQSVSWRLNNVGRASFFLPYSDPKCTLSNLQYGNRILVQLENGLPDFAGVIDTPRRQSVEGVTVTGYTAEKLLDYRITAKARYFNSAAPGAIYRDLITQANAIRPMGIDIGNVYVGGTGRTLTYHYHDLLARIKDLSKLSGHDFDITSTYEDRELSFQANWYDVKGSDKSGEVYMTEDRNVDGIRLNAQGNIANNIFLVGEGQTWGNLRYVAYDSDDASEADYGYREYAAIQGSVKFSDTLDQNAIELLAQKKDPRERFRLSVSNKEPGKFGTYDVGDRVTLEAFLGRGEWAHNRVVKIIAMQWNWDNTIQLEIENEW